MTTVDDILGSDAVLPDQAAYNVLVKTLADTKQAPEKNLTDAMALVKHNPSLFCKIAYPWGKGELKGSDGLRAWQEDVMQTIGKHLSDPKTRFTPLQIAVSSGHGVGKSSLVSMLTDWALSTCVGAKVVVTANTENQLRTKTWPEVTKWVRNAINSHWFEGTATAVISTEKDQVLNWRADAIPWSENNTEAFAGLHNQGKRLVLVFDEACHDEETEVLTDSGWKFFKNLTSEDKLLTMNRETHNAEYLRPTALHASHRVGEMLKYKIKGVDFKITPNHRMWVRSQKGDWSFRDAGVLASRANLEVYVPRHVVWNAPDKKTITIPALVTDKKVYPQLDLPADKMLELLGWYCSEGHLSFSYGRYRAVGFTQQNTSHIAALCEELGFSPKRYNECSTPQVRVHNTQFAEWVAQWGVGCKIKGVPDFVRTCSARQIGIFLDAYTAGDGYRRGKEDVIYTSSKRMADGLHELCYLAGQKSTMAKRSLEGKPIRFKTHNATSSCDGYAVSRSWSGTDIALKTRLLEKVQYDGMVYCATLPKHEMLFTRRNGVCLWSGNSAISDKVWEVAEGAMTDADTEIIWLAFGNPTQNTGRFRECFGKFKHRWVTRQIDSRTVEGTNKTQIQTWIDDYGEDSDFVRVRVRGEFPRSGNLQFIGSDVVEAARSRAPAAYPTDVRVMGVDVARFGCFDEQTEILTYEGWKFFPELNGADKVLTLNGDTAEWGAIDEIHKYAFDGELNLYESSKANFCVTDNHKLLVRSHGRSNTYVLKEYSHLPENYCVRAWNNWAGTPITKKTFVTRKVMPNGGEADYTHVFSGVDWAEFLGWFISEGNVYTETRANPRFRILITQNPGVKSDQIKSLLLRMGLNFRMTPNGQQFEFTSQSIGQHLLYECGHGASNKRVPEYMKNASPEEMRAFLDAFLLGDGTRRKDNTGRTYFSSSKRLIDDLQEMLAKLGCAGSYALKELAGSVFHIEGRKVIRHHDTYALYERSPVATQSPPNPHRDKQLKKSKSVKMPYKGFVWCVSTKYKTIYVRRKGQPMWSGNSDESVIVYRQGRDASSTPWEIMRGVDTMQLAARVMEGAGRFKPDAIFIDGGGVGGGVIDRLRMLNLPVIEVQFGAKADRAMDTLSGPVHYANKSAEMWGYMKDWLEGGSIPDDPDLAEQLAGRQYGYIFRDGRDVIMLEKKVDMAKRGLSSPDRADALSLTFSHVVMPKDHTKDLQSMNSPSDTYASYNPFSRATARNMKR